MSSLEEDFSEYHHGGMKENGGLGIGLESASFFFFLYKTRQEILGIAVSSWMRLVVETRLEIF